MAITVATYRQAQSEVARRAIADLERVIRAVDLSDPVRATATLAELMPALVEQHGTVAAAAAAEWYDAWRLESGLRLPTFEPLLAETVGEQVATSTRWAAAPLFVDDDAGPVRTAARLAEVADRLVKQAGRDTIIDNANADPAHPRWARVPSGTSTCAFCLMLASRGAAYQSEQSARGFHAYCDCTPTPVFSMSDNERLLTEGYDPTALYDRYVEAYLTTEGTTKATLSAMRSELGIR